MVPNTKKIYHVSVFLSHYITVFDLTLAQVFIADAQYYVKKVMRQEERVSKTVKDNN